MYIQDLITHYLLSRSFWSSSTLSLNPVSFNLKTYGSRAFSVSAPELYKLPDDINSYENLSLLSINLKPSFLRTIILGIRKIYLILYVFYLNLFLF